MEKGQVIEQFVANRPKALGAYGYGSGVFRQAGYDSKDDPQIDVIFLVDDLKKWHIENMKVNRDDYSFSGRAYIQLSNIQKLKGSNGITYFSQVFENGYRFKYGVMEELDFVDDLGSWKNFFIAGRFQKPVYKIKGNEIEEDAIAKNQQLAFLVTALLSQPIVSKIDFFKNLCRLSYMGALRMQVAENPNKINNIVTGNYERFLSLYDYATDYVSESNQCFYIDHSLAIKHVKELPISLLVYLYQNDYDFTNLDSIREGIKCFLFEHNRREELYQSVDTIKTNGIVRSIPYIAAKVKKRVTGK